MMTADPWIRTLALVLLAVISVGGFSAPVVAQDTEAESPLDPEATQIFREWLTPPRATFEIDPVVDGTLVAMGLGFALFSELAISSGELEAQPPGSPDDLLAIDGWVLDTIDPDNDSGPASDVIVGLSAAGMVVDALVYGLRRNSVERGLITGVLYIETAVINWTVANLVKLAVRRPRPRAYLAAENLAPGQEVDEGTNEALSFYSGHTAMTAAMFSTATYMAFVREGADHWWPWTLLGLGILTTVTVGSLRVTALAHFPTDVLAGGLFGAGVGILVPHFHRVDPSVWSLDVFGLGDPEGGTGVSVRYTF